MGRGHGNEAMRADLAADDQTQVDGGRLAAARVWVVGAAGGFEPAPGGSSVEGMDGAGRWLIVKESTMSWFKVPRRRETKSFRLGRRSGSAARPARMIRSSGSGRPMHRGSGSGRPRRISLLQIGDRHDGERRRAGDQVEERRGQAVDVQGGRHPAVERLGGHVGDRAGDVRGVGQAGRDAEIGQQGLVLAGVPEDVGRLDVAVDDPAGVHLQQALAHVGHVAGGALPVERTLAFSRSLSDPPETYCITR